MIRLPHSTDFWGLFEISGILERLLYEIPAKFLQYSSNIPRYDPAQLTQPDFYQMLESSWILRRVENVMKPKWSDWNETGISLWKQQAIKNNQMREHTRNARNNGNAVTFEKRKTTKTK